MKALHFTATLITIIFKSEQVDRQVKKYNESSKNNFWGEADVS